MHFSSARLFLPKSQAPPDAGACQKCISEVTPGQAGPSQNPEPTRKGCFWSTAHQLVGRGAVREFLTLRFPARVHELSGGGGRYAEGLQKFPELLEIACKFLVERV